MLLSPTKYLSLANVACAGLGFLQGLVTARLIGPDGYGIVAVIAGTNAAVLNFLDIRLVDLAGKLYYSLDLPDGVPLRAYRASVLRICLIGNALISLGLSGLGLLINLLAVGLFTSSPVRFEWIVAQTLMLSLANWTSSFSYLQRFSGRFYLIGTWKVVTQLTAVGVFLPVIFLNPNLNGYFAGGLAAAGTSLAMAAAVSFFIWTKHERFPILRRGHVSALSDYRAGLRFLVFGNMLGYTKMLHRSVDVLLVGFFADDRITGLYKLARSLTDSLYVLFDSLNQVYFPRFLELLSERAYGEYRRLARRLLSGAALFTAVLIAFEWIALPFFLRVALTDRFAGAESAILALTVPFVFVAGVYTWMWPIFVHSGRLGHYTLFSYAACLLQYCVAITLLLTLGATPVSGALGYLTYYLTLMPLAWLLLHRWSPETMPSFGQKASPVRTLGPSIDDQ